MTNPFFLFFVTSRHFFKIYDFVNYHSIWTNQIAKRWDQLPWRCHWNYSMTKAQSFIWHDVEQWVNLKWNAVTMKIGIRITIYDLLSEKMLSLEQLFLFTLHTTPAYAENKWRLVLYDFFLNTMSVTYNSHTFNRYPDCVLCECKYALTRIYQPAESCFNSR